MKKNFLAIGIIILVLVLLYFVVTAQRMAFPSLENSLRSNILDTQTPSASPYTYATTTISTPNGNIVVQIADTPDKQTQGLSDRKNLPQGTGMLFVFDTPAPQYMWMKDMNFALDMVWLDQNKNVVYIATDATPQSYRQNPPEIFSSPTNASYVIELPNGDAARLGITFGTKLNFNLQ